MVTIKDVFDAVQSGAADLGVVPFENSTHGVVTFTLDNLADRARAYADLTVCGEVYLDVHHFLLGRKDPGVQGNGGVRPDHPKHANTFGQGGAAAAAKPLHPLGHVRRVLSHPQAFGQTNAFLSTYLKKGEGVDYVDVSSTSRAAEEAARDATAATAAIAGEMAAGMFGLDVLARCIEDRDDNTTRFFVLRRGQQAEKEEVGVGEGKGKGKGKGKGHKSLVSFTVPHRAPGALAGVLNVFQKYGLNLTSINSLPSLIQPFHYLFFVEFEGSRQHDPEGRVENALGEIDQVAEGWRWLGSWESQR